MARPGTNFDLDFPIKERAMDEAPIGITISDPDLEDNPLVYVNDAFEDLTGFSRTEVLGRNCRFLQGDKTDSDTVARIRDAIDAEESITVELVNYRADGERFWNEVTIAPLTNDSGDLTHFVGFQADVTARKEATREVERRRRDLEHLIERINGLLQDTTEILMRSSSREENERELTERIASADPYVFAWFGELDPVAETIVPSSWAGEGESLDGIAIDMDADDPTVRAYDSRSIQTVTDIDGTACADSVPDARSMTAVPVDYGDRIYGVLSVYASDPDTFEARETVVIEALGRTIGTAINAAESRRVLTVDNLAEIEFELWSRDVFFVELAEACECRFEYRGSLYRSNGSLAMFFSTDGNPSDIIEHSAEFGTVQNVKIVSGDESGNLLEFHLTEGSIVTELAQRGVKTRAITAEGGSGRLTVEIPADSNPRSTVDWIRERYPGTELLAYREQQSPPTTKQEFIDELENRLTDRQLTALQMAYVSGYYEWNRAITGDALAESMDITRSTFHQHLRAAERKLIGEFFDR